MLISYKNGYIKLVNVKKIITLTEQLLSCVKDKKGSYDPRVFIKLVDELKNENSSSDTLDILLRLNKFLFQIEIHGFFTAKEYKLVCELREIESKETLEDGKYS